MARQPQTTDRALRWVRRVENAAITLMDDILIDGKIEAIMDTSILYGSLFRNVNTSNSSRLLYEEKASPISTHIHYELADRSPVNMIIPPYTAIEIINIIKRKVSAYRQLSDDIDQISNFRDQFNSVGLLSAQGLSNSISSIFPRIPTDSKKKELQSFVNFLRGPNVRSCSGVYGREVVLEAHRRAASMRRRLEDVFQSRTKHDDEDSFDFYIRNLTDADNLSITIELNNMEKEKKVNYAGPIPLEKAIDWDDLISLRGIQRNYLYIYLLLCMFRENQNIDYAKMRKSISIEAGMISEDAKKVLTYVPEGVRYDELTPAQFRSVAQLTACINDYRKFKDYSMEDAEKERENISSLVKDNNSLRDAFREHSESLDEIAYAIFNEFDDLNDEDVLDEFRLRDLREKGHDSWPKPQGR